jgi:hypothetical protein
VGSFILERLRLPPTEAFSGFGDPNVAAGARGNAITEGLQHLDFIAFLTTPGLWLGLLAAALLLYATIRIRQYRDDT